MAKSTTRRPIRLSIPVSYKNKHNEAHMVTLDTSDERIGVKLPDGHTFFMHYTEAYVLGASLLAMAGAKEALESTNPENDSDYCVNSKEANEAADRILFHANRDVFGHYPPSETYTPPGPSRS